MADMDAVFDRIFANVIGEEGGYVNDPNDPGQETRYGISKRSYPNEDIRNLTLDRARQIYYTDFYTKIGCDRISPQLAEFLFDYAVNSGTGRAAKALQEAVGVLQDCIIGPATLAAIAGKPQGQLLRSLFISRAKTMAEAPAYEHFKNGWFGRLYDLTMRIANGVK